MGQQNKGQGWHGGRRPRIPHPLAWASPEDAPLHLLLSTPMAVAYLGRGLSSLVPAAAVTDDHQLGGLKQPTFTVLQFWGPGAHRGLAGLNAEGWAGLHSLWPLQGWIRVLGFPSFGRLLMFPSPRPVLRPQSPRRHRSADSTLPSPLPWEGWRGQIQSF